MEREGLEEVERARNDSFYMLQAQDETPEANKYCGLDGKDSRQRQEQGHEERWIEIKIRRKICSKQKIIGSLESRAFIHSNLGIVWQVWVRRLDSHSRMLDLGESANRGARK